MFFKLYVKICLRVCSICVMGLVIFSKSLSYILFLMYYFLGCKLILVSEFLIVRIIRFFVIGFLSNCIRFKL